MNKYIIIYETIVEGKSKITYHGGISTNDKKRGFSNVYMEHITTSRNRAIVFIDLKEAKNIAKLFGNKFHKPTISLKIK
jgi:hypothetical protein